MTKEITFYIDKGDDVVSLHKYDRTYTNQLAEGIGDSIGKFVAILINEVVRMPKNTSITITVSRGHGN